MRSIKYIVLAIALAVLCVLCTTAQSTASVEYPGDVQHRVSPARMDYIGNARKQIVGYLDDLANLHCTEHVTQQKLDKNGHVEATQKSDFDYLIMMMGSGDDFELNESRREIAVGKHKNQQHAMLISNGISTALLVFHPYYRDAFDFSIGQPEMIDNHPALPINFKHVAGRRTPLALALRNREFPIDMSGTAWVNPGSGAVMRIEAHLQHEMTDVGLKSLNIRVDYTPVDVKQVQAPENFPSLAVVEVDTLRQHWRNTHAFANYRGFSTDAVQDPNVVVKKDKSADSQGAADTDSAQPDAAKSTPKE
jgi:hypothetical protein